MRGLQKYLARYAESEARMALAPGDCHAQVLVVPVYDDTPGLLSLLASVPRSGRGSTLLIAVLNAREDSPAEVLQRNAELPLELDRCLGPPDVLADSLRAYNTDFGTLWLLDRSSARPLPNDQGVGLARKLGADLALACIDQGRVTGDWIHFTDADAQLPAEHFERLPEGEAVAAVHPFVHSSVDPALQRVGALYEASLRYYVLGLQQAASPYAHHSIGSLISVRANPYAWVRGVPRRHGAEDFHLLAKLAKLGPVARLFGAPVRLQSRASRRIPFGTGPALRALLEGAEQPTAFYHPTSFRYLAAVLRALAKLAGDDQQQTWPALRQACAEAELDPAPLQHSPVIRAMLPRLETQLGAVAASPLRLSRLHGCFDALQSLRLLHDLRDGGLANPPWPEALQQAHGILSGDPVQACQALAELEQARCRAPVGVHPRSGP